MGRAPEHEVGILTPPGITGQKFRDTHTFTLYDKLSKVPFRGWANAFSLGARRFDVSNKLAVQLLLLAAFLCTPLLVSAQDTMSVTVEKTQLRTSPSFLGSVIGTLSYADRVQVISEQNGWMKVAAAGRQGWVHSSALTTRQIVLKAGDENVKTSASSGEVALAGRGFNKEVEAKYKSETGLDYTWVNKMESFGYDPSALQEFLKEGDLAAAEGGAQ